MMKGKGGNKISLCNNLYSVLRKCAATKEQTGFDFIKETVAGGSV